MPYSVLVVDDEKDIVDSLEFNLKQAGFRVLAARDGGTAVDLARKHRPDVILLDLMLPDLPGNEVLRIIRAEPSTRDTAVIILSARDHEIDRVVGFELGADDYLTKPFSIRELILRVRAVIRRAGARLEEGEAAAEGTASMGPIEIDEAQHVVRVDGASVDLTLTEFKLLSMLLRSRGRVRTRETLLTEVWGYDAEVISRTVDTHIRRLREKLGPAAAWLRTVRGIGYRLQDPQDP
jgi:two-component system phosphate regulon response regulator PhoB